MKTFSINEPVKLEDLNNLENNRYVEYFKGKKYGEYGLPRLDEEGLKFVSDAGYILKYDEVVIDIDCLNYNQLKALLDNFPEELNTEMRRTDRGIHIYYKKPNNWHKNWPKNSVCSLGFPIEYLSCKTNPNGVVIKRFGKERKVMNKGKRKVLPYIFDLCSRGTYRNCLGFVEGDGRNNNLFMMRQRLANYPNYKKNLEFINTYIFTEPLDKKELSVLLERPIY
ncbi:hypothetical protein KQI68_01480 [Peptoniphilus sp. MSJ-1]|uniref:DNA primase/polymerase bifunctional N-terminal domain-containing protein n=1 Tax=Peptoniphilus ovalis TaxID=2841503 RepID=A0ABS6FGB2_9FIRM|nr:hypothetical protein [Peptoniphilus ovalis]MBU5668503.1 hypothetical protein [Peptoniphilus ovalis]